MDNSCKKGIEGWMYEWKDLNFFEKLIVTLVMTFGFGMFSLFFSTFVLCPMFEFGLCYEPIFTKEWWVDTIGFGFKIF